MSLFHNDNVSIGFEPLINCALIYQNTLQNIRFKSTAPVRGGGGGGGNKWRHLATPSYKAGAGGGGLQPPKSFQKWEFSGKKPKHVIFVQNHLIFGQTLDKIFVQETSAPPPQKKKKKLKLVPYAYGHTVKGCVTPTPIETLYILI